MLSDLRYTIYDLRAGKEMGVEGSIEVVGAKSGTFEGPRPAYSRLFPHNPASYRKKIFEIRTRGEWPGDIYGLAAFKSQIATKMSRLAVRKRKELAA